MANQQVVDELVVKLELDASDYKKTDKEIDKQVDATEKKQKDVDTKRKRRDVEQKKRNQETLKSVKELALGMRSLALTIGGLLGVGSAAGIVGAVVALAGMETNLRRAAVSTGMSNRELQAWGSTARRLGADAQAGASAIADLAKEQQQFNITGNAPTIQAFARMGVRAGPGTSIVDILSQAQNIYRQSAPAQQKQIESGLAAQGVSPDLIIAIKSEKDVREEFARSYAESATENRKAMDAVTDALAGLSNSATSVANSIATIFEPQIEAFAKFVSAGAQDLSIFADKVMAAGGGVDGFFKVLDQESPELAAVLHDLKDGFDFLGQVVDVTTYGFQQLGKLLNKIDELFGGKGKGAANDQAAIGTAILDWTKSTWHELVGDARREGPAPVGKALGETGGAKLSPGAAARLAATGSGTNAPTPAPAAPATKPRAKRGPASVTAQDLMSMLITQYGLSVDQAAAVAASAIGESSLYAGSVNDAGGGTGARGLFQWRGPRTRAFQARTGKLPNEASVSEQLDFLMNDPYERRLLNRALSGPGGAADYGQRFNDIFEANHKAGEAARRGSRAAELASAYGGPTSGPGGTSINIQSMTVQANNPAEFSHGVQRQTGVGNYNSAVR